MSFSYSRTIHFPDTDAAGVVFFANYLAIAHEAYEEALASIGINLRTFFADTGSVTPIVKSEADYLRPLYCGDKLRITVAPTALTEHSYEIRYELFRLGTAEKLVARIRTEHICISSANRERLALPRALATWVKAG
jgi:1,4-dihydroxy-2-naphthoyl-CoA hydrolase